MTTELYNKGVEYAKSLFDRVYDFDPIDAVHDALLENDTCDEKDFFKKIKTCFYRNKDATCRNISFEKETLGGHFGDMISENGLHLKKDWVVQDWKVCSVCHEPKPEGCYATINNYSRQRIIKQSVCDDCMPEKRKKWNNSNKDYFKRISEHNKEEAKNLTDKYVLAVIMRRGDVDVSEITPEDIEIRRTLITLNRLSSVLGNGTYSNRKTYKYKRK